jgi:hypothetical protein
VIAQVTDHGSAPPAWLVVSMLTFSVLALIAIVTCVAAAAARRGRLTSRRAAMGLLLLAVIMGAGLTGYAAGSESQRRTIGGPEVAVAVPLQVLTFGAIVVGVMWAKRRFTPR